MPQPMSFLYAILLVSQLATYGRANRVITQVVLDNDLRNSCTFELGGLGYNLCPLIGERVLVKAAGVDTTDHVVEGGESRSLDRFYYIALGGMGKSTPSTEGNARLDIEESQCDEDTWVCLLDNEHGQIGHPIAGSLKANDNPRRYPRSRKAKAITSRSRFILEPTASLYIEDEDTDASTVPLELSLYGGIFQQRRQAATITFVCSAEESLRHLSEDGGVHSFSWATSHACPVRLTRDTSSSFAAKKMKSGSDSEKKESAPDPEEEKGDDDLLPPNTNRTRQWVAISAVVLAVIVFGSILLSSTRARGLATENLKGATYTIVPLLYQAAMKLRLIGSSLHTLATKPIVTLGSRFRQGDSKLVRWAQEDMALEEAEDVMVNGSGAYGRDIEGWNAEGLDEYIPLNFSPHHGKSRSVRSYGATPEVESFSERGALSGLGRIFRR